MIDNCTSGSASSPFIDISQLYHWILFCYCFSRYTFRVAILRFIIILVCEFSAELCHTNFSFKVYFNLVFLVFIDKTCWKFWLAFGCCALQILVVLVYRTLHIHNCKHDFTSENMFFLGIKPSTSFRMQTQKTYFLQNFA